MSSSNGRYGPDERPSIRMKHGQGPGIAIRTRHVVMDQCAHGIHVRITVCDHDSFRLSRGAARIVDGQQVAFCDLGPDENGR